MEQELLRPETSDMKSLFGKLDENIRLVEKFMKVNVYENDGGLLIKGENAKKAKQIIAEMDRLSAKGEEINLQKTRHILDAHEDGILLSDEALESDVICFNRKGRPISPKTLGQREYIRAMRNANMIFGIGPAGTGKTYLAVAMAAKAFKNRQVDRIILTRPAVEAGESLGFLPGDMADKVDPYLRPLYDALYDILGRDTVMKLREREIIEVAPLAFMRGRTLDDSYIILDEAQNTTREQMKMFLTRMGINSKVIVNGDITQIDLPLSKSSGLKSAEKILKGIEGIAFVKLGERDVVRHSLVREIITAYEKNNSMGKGE